MTINLADRATLIANEIERDLEVEMHDFESSWREYVPPMLVEQARANIASIALEIVHANHGGATDMDIAKISPTEKLAATVHDIRAAARAKLRHVPPDFARTK